MVAVVIILVIVVVVLILVILILILIIIILLLLILLLVFVVVLIPTIAIRAAASIKFLIKLWHVAGLLARHRNRTTTTTAAARHRVLLLLLLLLPGRKFGLGGLQLGEVGLGGQLLWVARQHHPIEEGDAVGGGDGERRRAVGREGVQRALGDALGDAVDCAGQGAGLGSGVSFVFAQLVALGRGVACLPDVAVDDQVLLLEALGQLELVIVHQRRIGDDNQWGADAQYFTDGSGAWDEELVATTCKAAGEMKEDLPPWEMTHPAGRTPRSPRQATRCSIMSPV